jgi:Ribbon-helix-helix protein, copG family
MRRITISLPDALAVAVAREAHRRRVPVSQVAREALEARLGLDGGGPRQLPFAALGRSGHHSTARDFEEVLAAAWDDDRDR